MRKEYPQNKLKKEFLNEKEINKCKIEINDKLIPFNYFYQFKTTGILIIKYSFINDLTKTNMMFSWCLSLKNIIYLILILKCY